MALTEEWFERVWNRGEVGVIEEMLCEQCEIAGLASPMRGPEDFKEFHRGFNAAFADIRVEITESATEGSKIVGMARFTGTHRASGKPIDTIFGFSAGWEEGRLVAVRNVLDHFALLVQMGAVSESVLAEAF